MTKPYDNDPLYELRGKLASTLGQTRLLIQEDGEDDKSLEACIHRMTADRLEDMLDRVDEALAGKYDLYFIGSNVINQESIPVPGQTVRIRADKPMREMKFGPGDGPPFPEGVDASDL